MAHILFYPVGNNLEELNIQLEENEQDLPTLPDPKPTTDPLEH